MRTGFTRRQVLAGAAGACATGVAGQLVSAGASFGQGAGEGALLVVFFRGGMDGLSVVVPGDDPDLLAARPNIAVPAAELLPLDRGFGLHPALAPLRDLWNRGQLTVVPAVATPDLSRSHFQAQDALERGGASSATTEGWLDRVLDRLGPGTTFRGVGQGWTLPRSMAGDQGAISVGSVDAFTLSVPDDLLLPTANALQALHAGVDHPIAQDVSTTLSALEIAGTLWEEEYQPAGTYPDSQVGTSFSEMARLIKGDVGLRVGFIDVGGWDMHTWLGTLEDGAMLRLLTEVSEALRAFADELGPRFEDVTIVTMSEFGRRVAENANAGTDHGHGGVSLVLGGGVAGGTVHGEWLGLEPEVLDQGDVPGLNDYRDLLGEVIMSRLGLGAADMAHVFPGHQVRPIGVMR